MIELREESNNPPLIFSPTPPTSVGGYPSLRFCPGQ